MAAAATCSSGETFFASLALALGLADVVTDEAGGMRLDTLFIDEGFGSLDDQALDEVLDVLDSLRERDRSVGIVSHVADLRTRVQAQLEVVKQRDGSAVRQRTGAPAATGTGDAKATTTGARETTGTVPVPRAAPASVPGAAG
ncbi:SbcC/MukB-like Walker B domain-containing protein [Streptomyces sp. 12297]